MGHSSWKFPSSLGVSVYHMISISILIFYVCDSKKVQELRASKSEAQTEKTPSTATSSVAEKDSAIPEPQVQEVRH